MSYVRRVCTNSSGSGNSDSRAIQNKLAQTLTVLFTTLYASEWSSFFDDLWGLAQEELHENREETPATLFYLRMLASVHDEIADQLINTSVEKQKLFTDLKDLIRARDATKIAASWQEILSRWRSLEGHVVELCLKTIGRWVSWSDITLIANQQILEHLYSIATRQGVSQDTFVENGTRDAAIEVFTEISGKKMQPAEKIELIRFINVDTVLQELIASPALSDSRNTPDYDTDLAEAVAKLVNTVVLDVVKVIDHGQAPQSTKEQAELLLLSLTPKLLRFLSDDFDEVCSTVIPALTEELTLFRKLRNTFGLQQSYGDLLAPILNAVVAKMRYDDTSTWGEEDEETDEAEFQELRKRLKVTQQIIATINEELYLKTLAEMVQSTLNRFKAERDQVDWRDLDVALVEMHLFGELAIRNSGLYQKKVPTTAASERLIHLMSIMIDSGNDMLTERKLENIY